MLAATDSLTRLHNRRYFDHHIRIQWSIAARNRDTISVFMIDVDHFKQFNDTYRHQAGDECLVEVSRVLSHSFRRGSDFLARYGGEKFIVLCAGMDESAARGFAESLRSNVAELKIPHACSTAGDTVSISVGCATVVPDGSIDAAVLIEKADAALYRAIREGLNRVVLSESAVEAGN